MEKNSTEMQGEQKHMIDSVVNQPAKKNISLIGAISIVMGNIIGSGIFVNVAGSASGAPHSPGLTLMIWVLGGIVSVFGALSYGELALYFHKSGGDFTYLHYIYGKRFALSFIFSHSVLVSAMATTYAALTASKYIINAILHDYKIDPAYERYMAISIILFLVMINMISVKIADRVQIVFTAAKIIGLIIIITVGIVYLFRGTTNFENSFDMKGFNTAGLSLALASTFFSFGGWNTLGHVVGEVSNPKRNIPAAFIIGLTAVCGLYLLTIVSYIAVLGHENMVNQKTVALGVGYAAFGQYGWVMSIIIVISTVGFVNGYLYSTARVSMVASYEGALPEFVGLVHKKTRSPSICIFIIGINSLIYIFINFDKLVEYGAFVSWTYFFLNGLGLCICRIRKTFPGTPEFKVPLIFPICLQLASLYIIGMTFYANLLNCFIMLLYMVIVTAIFHLPKKIIHFKPFRKVLGYFSYGLKIVFDAELVKESDLYSH